METEETNTAIAAGFPGFDEAYGNPPYKKSLHLQILENTLSVCKDNGIMTAIHPIRWMIDPFAPYRNKSELKKYYDLFLSCTDRDGIDNTTAGALFNVPFEYPLGCNIYEPIVKK